MSTMLVVKIGHYTEHSSEEAEKRYRLRGHQVYAIRNRLKKYSDWVEVSISAKTCHSDAWCGTGEELLLRILSEANVKSGISREDEPIEKHYKGRLFKTNFSIKEKQCPLIILELIYRAGQTRYAIAAGVDDEVDAVVMIPKVLAPDLAGVSSVDSCAWDGDRKLDHAARAARFCPRRAEIRPISAARRVLCGQTPRRLDGTWKAWGKGKLPRDPLRVTASQGDTLYFNAAQARGPTTITSRGDVGQPALAEKETAVSACLPDGDTLWVGTAMGLLQTRAGQVVAIHDRKSGLVHREVYALARMPDGTLVVGTKGGYSLLRDGQVIESVDKGLASKAITCIAVAADGSVWLGGGKGATRRAPDGTLTLFGKRQQVPHVLGFCTLPSGLTLIGATIRERIDWNAYALVKQKTLCALPGGAALRRLEVVSDFGAVVMGFQHSDALWLLMDGGAILRVVDGEPLRAFVLDNVDPVAVSSGWVHDGHLVIAGKKGVYFVALDALQAGLASPANTLRLLGPQALPVVSMPTTGAAAAAPPPNRVSIDVVGKKVCLTGRFAQIARSDAGSRLAAMGATVSSGVSKSTDFLFAGEGAGSKLQKARRYGVTVYGESELLAILGS